MNPETRRVPLGHEHRWTDWHPWLWIGPDERLCTRCQRIIKKDDPKFNAACEGAGKIGDKQ